MPDVRITFVGKSKRPTLLTPTPSGMFSCSGRCGLVIARLGVYGGVVYGMQSPRGLKWKTTL